MSGGTWDYKQNKLRWITGEEINLREAEYWLGVIGEALHKVDYAEANVTSRKDAEPAIYDLLLNAANKIWVDETFDYK